MKKYLFFLLFILFGPNYSLADSPSLKITEVMYDFPGTDDGHEYIKIKNIGSNSVDITGYKFIDGGSVTKHGINLPPKNGGIGSPIIAPSSFLILADNAITYLSDNPGYVGSVIDSTFSLNNDGGTVQLLDKNSLIAASYTYPVEVVAPPVVVEDPPDQDQVDNGTTNEVINNNEPNNNEVVQVEPQVQVEPINLSINEIMYDVSGTDDGREWIEVYNAGTSDVDLSSLKLFEAETNHGIMSISGSTLAAGGFAVIVSDPAKFSIDWPSYSGLVFDSTFSLSNTGEDLALKDADGNIIDQISFTSDMGATGNERSLQKNGSDFIEAIPTPGETNKTVADHPAEEESSSVSSTSSQSSGGSGSGSGSSASKTAAPKVVVLKAQKITLKIDSPTYAISNYGFDISASGGSGRYVWNFGNGEVIEAKNNEPFNYNYQFPGSYIVTLNYFQDEKSKPVKTSAKIKVDENPINISEIKEDGSVEIHNKATHQIDISGWILKSGLSSFTLPPETAIVSQGHIVLSSKITKFTALDKDIGLFYPSGETAFAFTEKPAKKEKSGEILSEKSLDLGEPVSDLGVRLPSEEIASSFPAIEPGPQIKGADLSASAINSVPESSDRPLYPWMLGLGGIIALSSVLSFIIFSGKSVTATGFKILD